MKMELAHLKINHHIELNKLFISRKYNANQTDQETSQAKPSQSVPEFHLNSITMSILFYMGLTTNGTTKRPRRFYNYNDNDGDDDDDDDLLC